MNSVGKNDNVENGIESKNEEESQPKVSKKPKP